jgi:hypothetical protein
MNIANHYFAPRPIMDGSGWRACGVGDPNTPNGWCQLPYEQHPPYEPPSQADPEPSWTEQVMAKDW